MAVCLYMFPKYAPWYIGYMVLFNMLVGPVFSAGSITGERERQTLDLLLTTTISPWQILWGKLVAGLRISSVLTMFLVWPVLLACVMVNYYWSNLKSVGAYILIILLTCLTTAMLALFCSVVFRKTSISLMTTYLVILVLFTAPLAVGFFSDTFFPDAPAGEALKWTRVTSPFAAAFDVPMQAESDESVSRGGNWPRFGCFVLFATTLNLSLLGAMMWLFRTRWRVAM